MFESKGSGQRRERAMAGNGGGGWSRYRRSGTLQFLNMNPTGGSDPAPERAGLGAVGPERTQGGTSRTVQSQPCTNRSLIIDYFELMEDGYYICLLCQELNPHSKRRPIKRQDDRSTNVFWRHFKSCHPARHAELKGEVSEERGQTHITDRMQSRQQGEPSRRGPIRVHTPDETKNFIARFVCLTDSPWSIVDNVTFKDMWRYATLINLDPPSAKVIKKWTIQMHGQMKLGVRKLWETVAQVSLIVDAWTAENGTGLLGITVHWVDETWTYRERVLAIREIVGKHDGENMASIVLQALDEFCLQTKVYAVTTDNATANKKMLALMARKLKSVNPTFTARRHVPCVAHILNIVVQAALESFNIPSAQGMEPEEGDVTRTVDQYDSDQDNDLGDVYSVSDDSDGPRKPLCLGDAIAKVRNLLRSIRSSTQRRELYTQACEDDSEVGDSNMVVLDCHTQWNSTYTMLAAAVKKRDVPDEVSMALGRKATSLKLSKDEWELVKQFCRILGRFAVSTDHVCKTVTPAICDVLHLINGLKAHMEEVVQQIEDGTFFTSVLRLHEGDRSNMEQACRAMLSKLAQYAEILWANEAITAAALMDPIHKGSMLCPGAREATIAYVRSLLPGDRSSRVPRRAAQEGQRGGEELDEWLSTTMQRVEPAPVTTRSAWDEFIQFLAKTVPNEGVFTPLSWWATMWVTRFPLLAAVARDLLSVCATSAPAECMFSVGNAIVTYKRSRLSPISIETLIIVKCWLRADNKRWYNDVELDVDADDDEDGVVTCARGDDQLSTNL
ncbi:putative transcriptional regulator tpeD isoform X2 [Wolffia australiana]